MSDETPVHASDARRIALLADTHCHAPAAADLPDAVLAALAGADLIVHLGDMGDGAVRDRLATVAPVLATGGGDDPPGLPARLVIEAGGLAIGALFDLGRAGLATVEGGLVFDRGPFVPLLRAQFGRSVDVLAFAGTHDAVVAYHGGVLLVNPGSPNLPARPGSSGLGTVALLDVAAGTATVVVRQL
jgi:putative phosphoesterase